MQTLTTAPEIFTTYSPLSDDSSLARRVKNYLIGYKMPGLRDVEVEADNGTVTLRGQVHSYYQRQLAIHCCRRVAGVNQLVDELEVVL